jgi:hypothetical protein
MARHFPDWLKAYERYASFNEAPLHFIYWVGVSTLAGALERKVWFPMGYFEWTPNFYMLLVAPPGVANKTTTAGVGMNLLREVEGVSFGPESTTWQNLAQELSNATKGFELDGTLYTQTPITIESGEFGNLFDPKNTEMVDFYVTLWDGKRGTFRKGTKTQGKDEIVNPWVNIIACTTPAWISGNFPEYMIGGGFMSRCLMVYADTKRQYVAYPGLVMPAGQEELRQKLIEDLRQIHQLAGPFGITAEAVEYGQAWYERFLSSPPPHLNNAQFGGYIARKQTHVHKLAMILAASRGDDLTVTKPILEEAIARVSAIEKDMTRVFSHIMPSDQAKVLEEIKSRIRAYKEIEAKDLLREVQRYLAFTDDFWKYVNALVDAGYVSLVQQGNERKLVWTAG